MESSPGPQYPQTGLSPWGPPDALEARGSFRLAPCWPWAAAGTDHPLGFCWAASLSSASSRVASREAKAKKGLELVGRQLARLSFTLPIWEGPRQAGQDRSPGSKKVLQMSLSCFTDRKTEAHSMSMEGARRSHKWQLSLGKEVGEMGVGRDSFIPSQAFGICFFF